MDVIDRRRRGLAAAVLVPATAFGWAALGPAAGASSTYQLTSAADGVRITVSAVNAPVTNVPFDLGAPVAQATLDSLQTSQSLAALPYPGDLVVAGPGTVAGFSGGKITPPDYPLVVQASSPVTPETTLDHPGYRLAATAGPSDAASSASSGLRSDSAAAAVVATSAVRRSEDGALRAASASEVTGFSSGPLTIGTVRSTAEVLVAASGSPTKQSALRISGMKVGDVAVELGPDGLALAGSRLPLPPTSPVAQSLTTNGIELGYLSPHEGDGVVVSPAVTVTVTRSVDGPVSPIRVAYILGRSVARAGTGSASNDGAGDLTGLPEPAADGTSEPMPADETTPSAPPGAPRGAVPPAGGSGVGSRGGGPGVNVDEPPLPGSDEQAVAVPPVAQPLTAQQARLAPPEFDTAVAYGLLVMAGLVLLTTTQLHRTITNRRAR